MQRKVIGHLTISTHSTYRLALVALFGALISGCGNQATKLKSNAGGGGNTIGDTNTQIACNIQRAHALQTSFSGGVAVQHRIRIQYSVVGASNPQVDRVRLNLRDATFGPPEDFCFDASGNRIVTVTFGAAPAGGFAPLGMDVLDATNLSRQATCTASSVELKDYTTLPESERINCAAGSGSTSGNGVPVATTVSQVGMLVRFMIATPEVGTAVGAKYDGEIDLGEGNAAVPVQIGAGFSNAVSFTHIFNAGTQATKNYTVKIRRLGVGGVVMAETTQEIKLISADMNPMPVYAIRNAGGTLETFSGTVNLPRPQWPRDVIAIGPGQGKDQVTTVYVYHPASGKTVLGNIVSASTPGAPVALGDINGDGHLDLIAGRFSGDGVVRITSGKSGLTQSFDPFGSGYNTGVWVSTMDTDQDGKHELIAGSQDDQVRVFSWQNGTMTLLSGISSSSGIKPFTSGDGNGMHVAGLGKYMAVIRGNRSGNENPIAKISAFPTLATFNNLTTFENDVNHGQHISIGYVDADTVPELLVCNEKDEQTAFQVRSLTFDAGGNVTGSVLRAEKTDPFGSDFDKGMSIAVADINNDGVGDIIAGSGEGTQTNVNNGLPVATLRIFNGVNLTQIGADFRPYGTKYVSVFVAGPPQSIR